MALLRVGALRRLGETANDFFVSRHLLPDGEPRVSKNLVFGGNVLPPVVVFNKLAAIGEEKTTFDKAAMPLYKPSNRLHCISHTGLIAQR